MVTVDVDRVRFAQNKTVAANDSTFAKNARRRRGDPQKVGSERFSSRTRLQVSRKSERDLLRKGTATERVSGDIFSKKENVAANDSTFAATWYEC